mgnify:CR=1 FL=1
MIGERQILNQKDIQVTIERLCQQLIEHHGDFKNTVIVGVQPRGTFLSNRIIAKLKKYGWEIELIDNLSPSINRFSLFCYKEL